MKLGHPPFHGFFSPDLDLSRNPAWSRMWSLWEDAYLSSQMVLLWLKVLKEMMLALNIM
jgi:hypothetical protein